HGRTIAKKLPSRNESGPADAGPDFRQLRMFVHVFPRECGERPRSLPEAGGSKDLCSVRFLEPGQGRFRRGAEECRLFPWRARARAGNKESFGVEILLESLNVSAPSSWLEVSLEGIS